MPDFTANTTLPYVQFSTSVECSGKAAEQLRVTALDGLLALPRVGMGVGGLLLGGRGNDRIRITEAIAIPCGHSGGPSFLLTPDEIVEARRIAASVAPLQVVGWYCSKTRGASVLSEQVLDLFQALCPELWQIMLLLRPSTVERSSAVLFVRNSAGQVLAAAERDLETESVGADAVPEGPESEPVAAPNAKIRPHAAETLARIPEALPLPPVNRPLFSVAEFPPQKPWLPWVLAGVTLIAFGAGGWTTRYEWLPRPALTLAATDQNGHLSIRWNSDAVRGIDSAVLSLNDGGELHSYELNAHLLEAGVMRYDRKSPRVTATLRVGETRALAAFLDPAAPEQNPPKAAVGPRPGKSGR
ncbi:MAG: hypothetical protein QOJ99_4495 [Bryobacterales bacterium]|nr:hypothetical protein [Bryobacterales bacterium]